MASFPCTDDPSEIIAAVVGASENAAKFDRFVNGTATEEVQLGEGQPTPSLRNLSHLVKSAASTLDGSDVSGKFSDAANGGTELRTLADRFGDFLCAEDYGAAGDGETDDTGAFAALEAFKTDAIVDLHGKTFAVDSIPTGNYYYNGNFSVNGTSVRTQNDSILARWTGVSSSGIGNNEDYFIADGTTKYEDIRYDPEESLLLEQQRYADGLRTSNPQSVADLQPYLRDVIAIGYNAMRYGIQNKQYLSDNIAIGSNTMCSPDMEGAGRRAGVPGAIHNIAIGNYALHRVTTGDRNIAIGSTALQMLSSGRCNVALGRDAAQSVTSGSYNTFLGYGSCMGGGDSGGQGQDFNGELCGYPEFTGSYNFIAGYRSGGSGNPVGNIIIGPFCGQAFKQGVRNVFLGYYAVNNIQRNTSANGKTITRCEVFGTYTCAGSFITVSCDNSVIQASQGNYCNIEVLSGSILDAIGTTMPFLYLKVQSSTPTSIVFNANYNVSEFTGGNCKITVVENSETSEEYALDNVCIGSRCLVSATSIKDTTVVGSQVGSGGNMSAVDSSVVAGTYALYNAETSTQAVVLGRWAAGSSEALSGSVVVGHGACSGKKLSQDDVAIGRSCFGLAATTKSYRNVAIGYLVMDTLIDGTETVENIENSTALGYHARVSGSNQVQLGNALTTTYAYGAVQDRSDARDKADIRDTRLGLDFLLALRPVDFKWDYRDAYIDSVEREVEMKDEEGNVIAKTVVDVIRHEKDGSRKRNRYHHGLIAQEVKAVLDEKGIDFGGYQDHGVNGGADVLTLGYEEFIGPIIKALQEINARLEALEER